MTVSLPFIDLENREFTAPGSRFVVTRKENQLSIFHIRYEVELENCLVARIDCGAEVNISAKGATLSGPGFQIIIFGPTLRVILDPQEVPGTFPQVDMNVATAPDVAIMKIVGTPQTWFFWSVQAAANVEDNLEILHQGNDEYRQKADQVVERWMEQTPQVLPKRQQMVNQCWWTLGANTINLKVPWARHKEKNATVVVPSKLGYVALWQWDTYFISLGLRHGNLQMAFEQLDIALYDCGDGQLPDVIHEGGMLASSEDLPEADRIRLEEAGSQSGFLGKVPLTKPPLGAWAANQLLAQIGTEEQMMWIHKWYPILRANTLWWMSQTYEGYPIYAHPYSSGLDDCPIFDGKLPVVSPDLLAYLQNQAEVLASWTLVIERDTGEDLQADRALFAGIQKTLHEQLQSLFNQKTGSFQARIPGQEESPRTIVSLLGCFGADLNPAQTKAITRDIENKQTFDSLYGIPTVARNEATYCPERMWRGPVWINTNYLVADGLERGGQVTVAKKLRQKSMAALEASGGPMEHFDPDTGRRAASATVGFGWSAALYIDLAVREAHEANLGKE